MCSTHQNRTNIHLQLYKATDKMSMMAHWHSQALILVIILDVISACPAGDWVTLSHQHICAVTGSSVVMPCSLTPPAGQTVTEVFWLINAVKNRKPNDLAQNQSYADRVKYYWDGNNNKNNCTLELNKVKMTDSAKYYTRIIAYKDKWQSCFHVTLSVTELTVRGSDPVLEGREVKLSCTMTCRLDGNPTVIWKKNGEYLPGKQTNSAELLFTSVSTGDDGDYACALKGLEGHSSKPVRLHVMFPPKNTSVFDRSGVEVIRGGSVNLTCSSDANPPVENYTWFKVDESTPVGSGQQHSITNIRSEDGGQYYCEARNTNGAENSTAVLITVTGARRSPEYMIAGVSVCGVAGLLCVLVWIRYYKTNRNDKKMVQDEVQCSSIDSQRPGWSRAAGALSTEAVRGAEDDGLYARVLPKCSRESAAAEEEYDVQYASVRFIKTRAV
ncbi:sialic acid-binding Ig-like lectin 12 isoform X2 [Alosa pseudoharengus]|uniref:sialic acid-binding Ig-like lectin 12 isoform X2 n=1 Tax=Alosa pseudoharengus TaxID=34774 RepID=UPI003F8C4605